MADSMADAPAEICYSFNVHRGSLCDPLGRSWHPNNPNYDPGPPPPPRPPKEKIEQGKKVVRTEGDTEMPQVSRQPRQPQRARGHHRYQKPGQGPIHRPRWPSEAVAGPSSGQTNGLEFPTGTNGGRGYGYTGPGLRRKPRGIGRGGGDGRRIETLNKYVRGLFRTLKFL
jgi:hypothetical protein